MNQMVFVLYGETIHVKRVLNLTRLSAFISSYLAKFMKHKKSNAAFWYEIVIIFSPIYLSEATFVISSFNLMTVL